MHPVLAILRTDALRLGRDRFLLGMTVYVAGIAVAMRWVAPWLQAEVLASLDFQLAPYLPMGMSYFIAANAAVIGGTIGGFLLLESKEERTLAALRVTPTPLALHLTTLAASLSLAVFLLVVAEAAIVGVGVPDWPAVLASAAIAAPMGVVYALILATRAANKVEAFAVMKITGFLGIVPLIAYFVPEPWQFLAGVVPIYWACKLWWTAAAGEPGLLLHLLGGLASSGAWIAWLFLAFQRSARR